MGRNIAARPELGNAFIELQGPLGAGKTTFVRHLLRVMGVAGRIKSPTYTLVEPYELPGLAVSHFDFYRFGDAREWDDAGFREVFSAPGLKLAEWPENAAGHLPPADVRLRIEALDAEAGTPRAVHVQALSPRGQALLE
jgi:tRNA threonylcarbamoyladenosine biosynthesis protein TsaE